MVDLITAFTPPPEIARLQGLIVDDIDEFYEPFVDRMPTVGSIMSLATMLSIWLLLPFALALGSILTFHHPEAVARFLTSRRAA